MKSYPLRTLFTENLVLLGNDFTFTARRLTDLLEVLCHAMLKRRSSHCNKRGRIIVAYAEVLDRRKFFILYQNILIFQ